MLHAGMSTCYAQICFKLAGRSKKVFPKSMIYHEQMCWKKNRSNKKKQVLCIHFLQSSWCLFCKWVTPPQKKKVPPSFPFPLQALGGASSTQTYEVVHPGRLTWNLKITHLERKMIFQTSIIMFHVNLRGCSCEFLSFPYSNDHREARLRCLESSIKQPTNEARTPNSWWNTKPTKGVLLVQ